MKDLDSCRSEFPITERCIYLNHASVSPLPRRSAEAMTGLAEDVMEFGVTHYAQWIAKMASLRDAAAQLIGSAADEIAITKNTSEGLSFIANGLDWKPGDVVAGVRGEFPANYFPWQQLERRGVNLRWIELRKGRVELEELDNACQGARLLAVSYVQYISGYRLDLEALGEICARRGTLLVVDAVQGLGPFPVNVKKSGVHALSASGHKWLLGPEGCGVLYVSKDLIPQVWPVEFGWTNVEGWQHYSLEPVLLEGADRYECGTPNTIGIYGLEASLRLFLEVGVERIEQRVHELAEALATGAAEKGYNLMTHRSRPTGSGIISIAKAGISADDAVARLTSAGVHCASRAGWVRLAPHFYLTPDEMARVVALLP